jgi:ABC-type transport system involved in multi-copper enzyme maturation permease subunit
MINPIFVNELRQSPLRRRWVIAYVVWCLISAGLIWMTDFSEQFAYQLAWVPMIILPLIVPSFAAGAFAKEYEQQTWQDLYLTRLTNWQVVSGKFWAALLQVWFVMLSFAPAIVLMLGRERSVGTILWWGLLFSLQLLLSACFYVLIAMVCSRYCATRRGALIASYISLFLYAGLNKLLWDMVGSLSVSNSMRADGSDLPLPFEAGIMQGFHLIFCLVIGGGSIVLLYVSMGEQRGYKSSRDSDRSWQPKERTRNQAATKAGA